MPTLLVVDDEPNVLYSLRTSLDSDTLHVTTVATGMRALEAVAERRPDAVLLDVRLGDLSGLEVYQRLRAVDPHLPVIFMTAYTTTETAIEAMKQGAFEYLLKPIDLHRLREVLGRAFAVNRMMHVPAVVGADEIGSEDIDRIVGRSPAMQEVYKAIGRIASQDVTVLILGESGTGKELVARALYQHSRRVAGPFVALNCAAIPEALLESELFGHERGAFTGADRRRIGKFEQADRGTIFLDEIGDMTAATQAKMLRLLQRQRFERLGGNETIQADVRVIAATNQSLGEAVTAGRFRQDLFYRLNGFTITLPPLRERREDIPLLVEHFLALLNPALGRHVASVSPEALALLQAHDWPGNVRELQSTVRYALVHARGDLLTSDYLPAQFCGDQNSGPTFAPVGRPADELAAQVQALLQAGETDIYRKVNLATDRVILETVLRYTRGNQLQASELLGISRTTLRAKLRTLGLAVEKQLLTESGHAGQNLSRRE